MTRDTAIDRFFDAALHPEDWPSALEAIAGSLDADGATLIFGPATRDTLVESIGIRDYVADYFANGLNFDPREQRVRAGVGEGFLADARHFTEDEIRRDPFYRYLRKHRLGWHAVACLADRPAPIVLSLKRGDRGPFERSEVEKLDEMLPHLRAATNAARLTWSMALDDQMATLARVGHHAVLLDRQGRATATSPGFVPGDGLQVRGRHLVASYANDQAMLDRVVGIATAGERPSDLPAPPAAILHRPSGRHALIARAMPLDRARQSLMAPSVAILVVTDLDRASRPDAAAIRGVFGLTPKEAELAAALSAGKTVEEAAEILNISTAHARQRLKIVLSKTQTHRQSELIALLARLA